MQYQEALTYIHSLGRFNGPPSLDRMRKLMALLGDPQERLRVVHIAGTNGKGSTAAMTAGILRASGFKTGLTVSPFILDFCERIQIDGEMIPRGALAGEAERIRPFAEQVGGMTEFEVITAAAYDYFERQGCEMVVAEVGLGGRFDATNVISKPLVTVITQIGLDHTALLGDTAEKIAFEKCGIIKPGVPVISCPGQEIEAQAVILEQACLRGCRVEQPNLNAAEVVSMTLEGTVLRLGGLTLRLPLLGGYQVGNALTAVLAASRALAGAGAPVSEAAITEGIAGVRFPARMELLRRDPVVLLDGAHNPPGARALAQALTLADGRPLTGLVGMLGDKDSSGALEVLAPLFRRVYCVTPDNPRALDARELARRAGAFCAETRAFDDKHRAWNACLEAARAEGGAVVVCGSLYLAAELRPMLRGEK